MKIVQNFGYLCKNKQVVTHCGCNALHNEVTIMESCSGHTTVGIVLYFGDLASSSCFPYRLDLGFSATLSRCLCQW